MQCFFSFCPDVVSFADTRSVGVRRDPTSHRATDDHFGSHSARHTAAQSACVCESQSSARYFLPVPRPNQLYVVSTPHTKFSFFPRLIPCIQLLHAVASIFRNLRVGPMFRDRILNGRTWYPFCYLSLSYLLNLPQSPPFSQRNS
jgi:hypothetical protein